MVDYRDYIGYCYIIKESGMITWILCILGFHQWKTIRSVEINSENKDKGFFGILCICPCCGKYRFFTTKIIFKDEIEQ
jgi:hypothetical protein